MKLFLSTLVTYFGVTVALYCQCQAGYGNTSTNCVDGAIFMALGDMCDVGPTDGGNGGWNCARLKKIYNGCQKTFCNGDPENDKFVQQCTKNGLTGDLPVEATLAPYY